MARRGDSLASAAGHAPGPGPFPAHAPGPGPFTAHAPGPGPLPRVASLVPSGTDLVAALGMGRHLVGVSHECDHPAATGLPTLTSSTLPGRLAPAEVDRRVVEATRAATPLYRADRALLASLDPGVVVSQDVCDVCAVPGEQAGAAAPGGARLVMLRATTLRGLSEDLAAVGDAIGAPARAQRVVRAVSTALTGVSRRVAGAARPRVLALEWSDPPFTGGHWVPELVEVAGGEPVLSGAGEPSRRTTWDEIAAADPDLVVLMPCGYRLDAAVAEARELRRRPEVARLRAVRRERFWATDAAALFSRCTPVVATAAAALAAMAHPERFPRVSARRAVRVGAERAT